MEEEREQTGRWQPWNLCCWDHTASPSPPWALQHQGNDFPQSHENLLAKRLKGFSVLLPHDFSRILSTLGHSPAGAPWTAHLRPFLLNPLLSPRPPTLTCRCPQAQSGCLNLCLGDFICCFGFKDYSILVLCLSVLTTSPKFSRASDRPTLSVNMALGHLPGLA